MTDAERWFRERYERLSAWVHAFVHRAEVVRKDTTVAVNEQRRHVDAAGRAHTVEEEPIGPRERRHLILPRGHGTARGVGIVVELEEHGG